MYAILVVWFYSAFLTRSEQNIFLQLYDLKKKIHASNFNDIYFHGKGYAVPYCAGSVYYLGLTVTILKSEIRLDIIHTHTHTHENPPNISVYLN